MTQLCINCNRKNSCPDPSETRPNDYACFRTDEQDQITKLEKARPDIPSFIYDLEPSEEMQMLYDEHFGI